MIKVICEECKGDIKMGIAINPFNDGRPIISQPLINSETLQIITVYKCSKCGNSYDDERQHILSDDKLGE